jgi:hypothetical protein
MTKTIRCYLDQINEAELPEWNPEMQELTEQFYLNGESTDGVNVFDYAELSVTITQYNEQLQEETVFEYDWTCDTTDGERVESQWGDILDQEGRATLWKVVERAENGEYTVADTTGPLMFIDINWYLYSDSIGWSITNTRAISLADGIPEEIAALIGNQGKE